MHFLSQKLYFKNHTIYEIVKDTISFFEMGLNKYN